MDETRTVVEGMDLDDIEAGRSSHGMESDKASGQLGGTFLERAKRGLEALKEKLKGRKCGEVVRTAG